MLPHATHLDPDMATRSAQPGNVKRIDDAGFLDLAARYIEESSVRMHGVESRTAAHVLAAENLRLNGDVMEAARHGVDPFLQPANFQGVLIESADRLSGAHDASSTRASGSSTPVKPLADKFVSLAQTARMLREGAVTCTDLVRTALDRAEQTQPTLNAFLAIWEDQAMQRAEQLDRELQAGLDRGLLHGIVLAHKDCFNVAGHAATIGSRARQTEPARTSATIIDRLAESGSINLGALNLSEMVAGPTGQNPIFGDCGNAIDPARISGGSSSGSGSAVAAGIVYGSIGSDTGGSVRIPASLNGLYGIKPTYGRVSRAGCFPRSFSVDCPGPLARTAEDCAALLQVVAGHDSADPSSLPVQVPDYLESLNHAATGSRVAILNLGADYACEPQIKAEFEKFAVSVERMFGAVGEVRYSEVERCNALSEVISKVEAATVHAQWMRQNPRVYSQSVYTRTETGLHIPAVRYMEALVSRIEVLRSFLQTQMGQHDMLICPTVTIPTPLRSDLDMDNPDVMLKAVRALTCLTRPFNYLGLPALSMPMGLDQHGMPVGVQIIGRPLSESRLLSFAHIMSTQA